MSGDEIFGYGWREDHARAGDECLTAAHQLMEGAKAGGKLDVRMDGIMALAAIAQAHYAAANIRTRPIRDAELNIVMNQPPRPPR